MVVSDMDGTLLNSNHEVSEHFFELFEKLKAKNIQFVAASGRQYHSMVSKLQRIQDDILFISENGALVKKGEEELSTTLLDKPLIEKLLEIIEGIDGGHAMLCGKYTSYFDGRSKQFLNQLKEYYSAYEIVDDYKTIPNDIVKIAVYHPTSAEDHIYPKVAHLENQVKVKVSGQNWVDLNHVNADKGKALKKVMALYGLEPHEILAIGDYNNDIEMLQLVDHSFAMANAHPNVKKVAKYQTSGNDAFGVETILEKLL